MPNQTPPLILIGADDQAVCEALQFALRLEGFSVQTHRDATGLLTDPDLGSAACVILDDRKPHLDAFELLDQLRTKGVPVPVILLTGHATKRLRYTRRQRRNSSRAGETLAGQCSGPQYPDDPGKCRWNRALSLGLIA